jgi:sugar/nucleoside kinase (ribokinase family)
LITIYLDESEITAHVSLVFNYADNFKSNSLEHILVTSKKGVFFYSKNHCPGKCSFIYEPSIQIEESLIVNPNGAGDSLLAGFITAVLQKKTIQEALKRGVMCAYLSLKSNSPISPEISASLF